MFNINKKKEALTGRVKQFFENIVKSLESDTNFRFVEKLTVLVTIVRGFCRRDYLISLQYTINYTVFYETPHDMKISYTTSIALTVFHYKMMNFFFFLKYY